MRSIVLNIVAIGLFIMAGCSKDIESEVIADKIQTAKPVILATTTSTYDSGLLDDILPGFEKKTGISVKTVAVGTGQALELGRRGEADVLLVHAPKAEEDFVALGNGKNRRPVMHNDFVLIGPKTDPAKVRGMKDAAKALSIIAKVKALWASRGDRSGTHHKEKELFEAAGVMPLGDWFMETGQGMGATLRLADEKGAYTISDRGTFLSVENIALEVLVQGDLRLFNPYHVIEVVHENANSEGGRKLADYFVSEDTQKAIGAFESRGFKLFTPDALKGQQK